MNFKQKKELKAWLFWGGIIVLMVYCMEMVIQYRNERHKQTCLQNPAGHSLTKISAEYNTEE